MNSQDTLTTRRPVSQALEEVLGQEFPVLDHGFVRVVDYMGDDSAVVQAARVSYGKGTKKSQEDKNLIFYLMRHKHTTPFEMCEIKFHIKLPIFVARQWVRHRTASINEYSARYSVLDKEFYIPSPENLTAQSASNRQGREDLTLDETYTGQVLALLKEDSETLYSHYDYLLNEPESPHFSEDRPALARELARMNLSLNYYTQWYWKINLHNLLHFLRLRADSHAQYEIRVYAEVMLDLVRKWVPAVYEAFCEYHKNGTSLSAKALEVLRHALSGQPVSQDSSGLGVREWNELCAVFPQLKV